MGQISWCYSKNWKNMIYVQLQILCMTPLIIESASFDTKNIEIGEKMNGANIVVMFNRSEGNLRAFLTSLIMVEQKLNKISNLTVLHFFR